MLTGYSWAEDSTPPGFERVLEEVIVTAQRREQNIQDIGMSIHAFTAEQVRDLRLQRASMVAEYVPNVTVKTTYGNQSPVLTMRGIGLNDEAPNGNSSVGVYVDDVNLSSITMMSFQVFDTERVEVLLGPQGTLYGRNTSAGAIKYISRKPSEGLDAYTRFDVGNYETFEFEGAVGGSLGKSVNGRLAVFSRQQGEGHATNRLTGHKQGEVDVVAARAMLDWQASRNVSVLFNLHAGRDHSDLYFYEHLGFMDPATGAPCQAVLDEHVDPHTCTDVFGYSDPDGDPFRGDYNEHPWYEADGHGGSITLDWALSGLSLTSITSYEDFHMQGFSEADASPFIYQEVPFDIEIKQYSQEIRLTSESSETFGWVAGLFWAHDEVEGVPGIQVNLDHLLLTQIASAYDQETDATALFAHGEWQLDDRWRLIAGARYTYEDLSYVGGSADLNPFGSSCILDPLACNPGPTGPIPFSFVDDSFTDSNLSGELGVDFSPRDNRLVYGKVTSGYKGGGWDGTLTFSNEQLKRYDPETVLAWEIGFKTTWPEQSLQFNVAAFYNDFEDIQIFALDPESLVPLESLTNATGARTSGIETWLQWVPLQGLDLRFALGYLDTENEDPRFEGKELVNAPKWSANGFIRYRWQIGGGLEAYIQSQVSYKDEAFTYTDNNPIDVSPSHTLVDARAGITSDDGRWEVALWAQNLFDEEYFVNTFNGGSLFGRNGWRIYGMPRTYGLSFTYHWE